MKVLRSKHRNSVVTIRQAVLEQSLLASFNHPHILGYVGTGFKDSLPFLVIEKVETTLSAHITAFQSANCDEVDNSSEGGAPFPLMEVLVYGRMIAEALLYLHYEAIEGHMVLHRDLKPDNIGIAADGSLKLLDFGLARTIQRGTHADDVYKMTGETGSLRYMAPEVARGRPYNEKADVYSLALILWQLAEGTKPFQGMNRKDFYSKVVNRNYRPGVNKNWPASFSRLIEQSWDPDLYRRPNTKEFLDAINMIIEEQKVNLSKKRSSVVHASSNSFGIEAIKNALRSMKVSVLGNGQVQQPLATGTFENTTTESTLQRNNVKRPADSENDINFVNRRNSL